MSSLGAARAVALSLPEAVEQEHHGLASFRVRGRIFATVPDPGHLRVMLGEEGILAAVAENADCCRPFWWGRRLSCAVLDLGAASDELVRELVTDAWRAKAPATLRRAGPVSRPAAPAPWPSGGERAGR